jgi:hypothetical protein
MTAAEQNVAGIDPSIRRDVHHNVASRVCGAEFLKPNFFAADVELEFSFECVRWECWLDIAEVEPAAHHFLEECRSFATHTYARSRSVFFHFVKARRGRDNPRAIDQLIPIGMVEVRVRVDQGIDLGRDGDGGAHAFQHIARALQIDQRIDKQSFRAVGDEAGIAVASRAVRLQVCVATVAELVQAVCVLPLFHRMISYAPAGVAPPLDRIAP